MNETRKRRESIGICVSVVVAYVAMYVLALMYENAIAPGIQIGYVFKKNVESLVIALILALIPYERIAYVWNRDLLWHWFEIKSKHHEKNMVIEAAVLYGILSGACIWVKDNIFRWNYRDVKLFAFVMTILMAWIVVNSFGLIKSNVRLFIVDLVFIMSNGVVVYLLTNSFYNAALITVAMFIGWNVCNFMSDRKYKLLGLFASVVSGAEMFNIAVDCAGKYRALDAWLNPTKEMNLPYSWEYLALNRHSLKMPDDFPWYRQFNHPFISINHYLGMGALIVMILAFVIITIAFIRSHKVLSEKRFKLLAFIYILFAVLYVYTFLADLGFVPTAGNVLLVSEKIYIVAIGIVIRQFVTRTVPDSKIETYSYTEETYDDDEYMMEELLKNINLLNENLEKILEKIGEDKTKECDDGYEK